MICLADNDIIKKLAACDVLNEALQLLQTQDSDVRVLPTARFFFANRNTRQNIEELCTRDTLNRIDRFLAATSTCSFSADPLDLAALNVRGIDAGEAVFFAVTDTNCRLATGDRKCLKALADAARIQGGQVAGVHARWQNRVAWFDHILAALARSDNTLVEKMWQGCACDGALMNAFSSGGQTPVADVIRTLESRAAQVQRESNGLLLTF